MSVVGEKTHTAVGPVLLNWRDSEGDSDGEEADKVWNLFFCFLFFLFFVFFSFERKRTKFGIGGGGGGSMERKRTKCGI